MTGGRDARGAMDTKARIAVFADGCARNLSRPRPQGAFGTLAQASDLGQVGVRR